jgi:HAD superfamily phosphatase (TIGR01668 family)
MSTSKYQRFKKLVDIPLKTFIDDNIKCVMLDIDSTLIVWRGESIGADELKWCKNVLSHDIDIVLVSNAKKERAVDIAKQLDIEYISPAYKPWPFGILKAVKLCAAKKQNCVMIGDQLLTDRVAALLAGVSFILLEPLSNVEFGWTKVNRIIEKYILRRKNL